MRAEEDPEFLDALGRIFMTRTDMRNVLDYQQKLFTSLQELSSSHRAVHDHVRKLTESHNRNQSDTTELVRARNQLNDSLRVLDDSHRQTQNDIRRAVETLNYMQQEIRKVPQLEDRIEKLER